MKIVCDSCDARYSIGDDRVVGKVFKVRCKKCSHVIIVRGLAPEDEPRREEPREGDWHAIVDGAQLGPFDAAELQRRRLAGELDDDSLVWREGFADWQPLGQVDELRAPGPSHDEPRAPGPSHDEPRAEASRTPALHNERNETSVLFTLGNLAKLAAGPKPAPDAASGTEGSGLIDIRSLARALATPAAPATRGSSDDLPSYAQGGFIEPAVMVPVARGDRDRRLIWALGAAVGAIVLLATILVIIVVGRDGGTRHAEAAAAPPRASAIDPSGAGPADGSGDRVAAGDHGPAGDRAVAGARVAVGDRAVADDRVAVGDHAVTGDHGAAGDRTVGGRDATPGERAPADRAAPRPDHAVDRVSPDARAPVRAAAPHAPSRAQPAAAPLALAPAAETCAEVSCVVSGYAEPCCRVYREKAAAKAPTRDANLPDNLDRDAIAAGLAKVDVKPCGGKSSARGRVRVSIHVAADGSVRDASVTAAPDDALGSCVVAAAKRTSFARTAHGGSFFYVWSF